MQHRVRTMVVAGHSFIDSFKKYCDNKTFDLAYTFGGHLDEIEKIASIQDCVVVIDTLTVAQGVVKEITARLTGDRIGYIAIVGCIKDGFDYLSREASDMIIKPDLVNTNEAESFFNSLCLKIKNVERAGGERYHRELKYTGPGLSNKIIAIGSSTGGTETVLSIIRELPHNCPPVLVTQHMPPVFTKLYAQRLDRLCAMSVWEAKDGDALRPGLVLIAPGDHQMRLVSKNDTLSVAVTAGEKYNGFAPSVDVLFNSVAQAAGGKAIGVILTGMGADGASGLKEMRKRGAMTLGQDEKSSIVYGMPKVAFETGAVIKQASLTEMAAAILACL